MDDSHVSDTEISSSFRERPPFCEPDIFHFRDPTLRSPPLHGRWFRYAFLDDDGKVYYDPPDIAKEHQNFPNGLSNVNRIVCNEHAYAALTNERTVTS